MLKTNWVPVRSNKPAATNVPFGMAAKAQTLN
jgi:hypothetical protein